MTNLLGEELLIATHNYSIINSVQQSNLIYLQDGLQNKIKTDLDAKLLGSDKYCNYLYNTIRTRHSNKIFDKYCKNKINKKYQQVFFHQMSL